MLIERFSVGAQGATEAAGRLAVRYRHAYITPRHLLLAMLQQDDSHAARYLEVGKVDTAKLTSALEAALKKLPASGGDEQHTSINRDLEAVFVIAEETLGELGNRYIGANHLLLGMLQDAQICDDLSKAGADLDALKTALKTVRAGNFKGSSSLSEYEFLAKYGNDLTARARAGKLDPVIGRDPEIRQVIQVLSRRLKNNPVIVGEPGVGKTAIVEGLAQRIAIGAVPDILLDHLVVALDIGSLVAGTKFRGEFEERFKKLLEEVSDAGNVLLFIDELHMLIGTGGKEGGTDASNLLKPALSRGEFRCIGSTTLTEYRKYIEKDAALSRRFQLVSANEPTPEQALTILRGLKQTYEVHHGVRITDAAINAAVKFSHRYITDRFLPDKAIDLIDQSAATIRTELASRPAALDEMHDEIVKLEIEIRALEQDNENKPTPDSEALRSQLQTLKDEAGKMSEQWQREKQSVVGAQEAKRELEDARREMEQKIREEDYARVAELQYKIVPEREKRLADLAQLDVTEVKMLRQEVTERDVAETVSRLTGVPVTKMLDGEAERLKRMHEILAARVVGQDDACAKVAKAVRRSRASMQDPNRPLASFMFLGATGVGKTELAKALASFMFSDEKAMIRIDMSEYMEKHSVARLVGAPPGYVGYEEGGTLTNQVKRKPYSVVLLDEVEKAHADVFNILLQVLDEGHLTDSQGTRVNFKNSIIILTSNLGARLSEDDDGGDESYERLQESVMAAVRSHFRPEFINRIDDTLVFRPLDARSMQPIARLQIERVSKLLSERGNTLDVSDDAVAYLAEAGFHPMYGARPLKRVVQEQLQDVIADLIIDGGVQEGQALQVTRGDAGLLVKAQPLVEA